MLAYGEEKRVNFMSHLHQLQVSYDQMQDRLILFLYTKDFQEYRFALTRHCTKILWKVLIDLLHASNKDVKTILKEDERIAEQIETEKTQQQPTAAKFSTQVTVKPLGEMPVLVTKFAVKPEIEGKWRLRFEVVSGQSLEIGGDSMIALALCQMLRQTSKAADWQLNLTPTHPS